MRKRLGVKSRSFLQDDVENFVGNNMVSRKWAGRTGQSPLAPILDKSVLAFRDRRGRRT
jgi:hypothetical protein